MPDNKKTQRPDTPLANTPEPVKIDNTYVKKPKVGIIAPQPKYKYVEAEVATIRRGKPFSKQDSLKYKESFQNEMGVKGLANKVFFSGYSSGELEAKDLKKSKKKIVKKA
jgi:hypothetical protein